ncbi:MULTISPECIES: mannose-1-phosphate guanyltransferase [Streptomyces]|uniref:Mannose-1-phosphate guanyltransferase n=1 Tax=Streptomyces sp. 900116325 TaxID=3154295 RepID=A0ABV2UGA5_9ACTN|nr:MULTISPECIES: mannose-1-phosphate guanyltransferase [unclassified Streptomyces]WTC83160.1 mannose-1-phosphate guanyltransferase [Streptomyces sp. NBC_01653]WTD32225.1 mannose-1-phosphate guanyltransferase [Streptomyces sp. NBC_01643]WTD87704.1 mannose-1-phosphate guanyltransferase [Streptomyces sp. NBC_01637]WSA66927.1 mannose-1-phosphate guanyltransferase [Streptomyces sp. NBC_01800]WSC35736.1 mannose-1-phosphate guanyltransferase [Streptomyces sp. NBC_01763]
MKAVVMAGGEGTRLRPMTSSMPKPLLPVANRPIMEHVLRLLKRHGLNETVVTVQFLASLVKNYFGDGEELGMELTYANEEKPLGTAGSVKNAEEALKDDTFLVISGDALTDFDLTDLIAFHKEKGGLVTVCLTRVPNPLEFGITIVDEGGQVERFLEKPTWGQVFSDTVNTGIYVMEPEVFDYVEADVSVDWSGDVFPQLMKEGKPIYGYVAEGYWEDVGTHESYVKAQADVLERKVDVEIDGFEISPGVWVAEGAEVHPDAVLRGPVYIGDYAKIEAGAELREHTVVGSNVVVKTGAFLHRAVIHDNVYIGQHCNLRGCVVGKNTDIMRAARIEDGAVIGDECLVGEESIIQGNVRVYPFKTIEAGAFVNTSVIWESRGQAHLFGARGVSGILNVEITPELAVRLAGAYATTLKKGSTVTTARDHSRGARALKRAVISALQASAIDVRDLENVPLPVARQQTARGSAGGIMIRTSPGVPDSVDIMFFDERGADLSQARQRKLDRVYARQEYRRAFPGEIGDLHFPSSVFDSYTGSLLRNVDTTGIAAAGLKVVVDASNGSAGLVLPSLLGRLGVDALTINPGLDESRPTESADTRRSGLVRLGEIVSSARAAFGVRFDPVGERLSLVDERGRIVEDDRALLVLLDLVAAERRSGRVALPVTTTRVAEQVAAYHGTQVEWTTTSPDDLTRVGRQEGTIFGGDGRGGFIVPEFSSVFDGSAAFVRLIGLVARTQLTLSQIDARIPRAHVLRRDLATPWAVKGLVMRRVVEAAGDRDVDTTDGVRVVEADGRWVMVLPDPAEAVTHLWAEGPDDASAQALLDEWSTVVDSAGH